MEPPLEAELIMGRNKSGAHSDSGEDSVRGEDFW